MQNDEAGIIAFNLFGGLLILSWIITSLADRVFSPERSSPLITTLFFRTVMKPDILGIDPLYVYYYLTNLMFLNTTALAHATDEELTLAYVSWSCLGWSLGQYLASFESNRHVSQPVAIPRWLIIANMLLMKEELTREIS